MKWSDADLRLFARLRAVDKWTSQARAAAFDLHKKESGKPVKE